MKILLGKKIGMTQIFTEAGEVIPVSVIEAGPQIVTQIKTVETDGYNAVQVGFQDAKPQRVNKPMTGHFNKAGQVGWKLGAQVAGERDLEPGCELVHEIVALERSPFPTRPEGDLAVRGVIFADEVGVDAGETQAHRQE